LSERVCPECGTEGQNGRFCSACGALVKVEQATLQPVMTSQAERSATPPLREPNARAKPGRSLKPKVVIAGLAALVIAGAGLVIAKTIIWPDQHTFKGSLQLSDLAGLSKYLNDESCSGSGGYADIITDAQVTVFNDATQIIGTGRLSPGKMQGGFCVFSFSMSNVSDSNIYQIEVGREGRGKQRYISTDVERMGYQFALSLGDGIPVPERPVCPETYDITGAASLSSWKKMDLSSGELRHQAWFTVTISNRSSVEVQVKGGVVATYANGKTEGRSLAIFVPSLPPGETRLGVDTPYTMNIDALTSWGKPKSASVFVNEVTTNVLCK